MLAQLGCAHHFLQAKGEVIFSHLHDLKKSYSREDITGELENLQNFKKKICRRGRGRCKELEYETKGLEECKKKAHM